MNAPAPKTAMLSEAAARAFAREIAKYPPEGKASAVIACLAVLQEEHGFISQESEELVAHAERKLGIRLNQSTADGRIFLKQEEECLAACTGAPMMMVDHDFHENLTPEKLDAILDALK